MAHAPPTKPGPKPLRITLPRSSAASPPPPSPHGHAAPPFWDFDWRMALQAGVSVWATARHYGPNEGPTVAATIVCIAVAMSSGKALTPPSRQMRGLLGMAVCTFGFAVGDVMLPDEDRPGPVLRALLPALWHGTLVGLLGRVPLTHGGGTVAVWESDAEVEDVSEERRGRRRGLLAVGLPRALVQGRRGGGGGDMAWHLHGRALLAAGVVWVLVKSGDREQLGVWILAPDETWLPMVAFLLLVGWGHPPQKMVWRWRRLVSGLMGLAAVVAVGFYNVCVVGLGPGGWTPTVVAGFVALLRELSVVEERGDGTGPDLENGKDGIAKKLGWRS